MADTEKTPATSKQVSKGKRLERTNYCNKRRMYDHQDAWKTKWMTNIYIYIFYKSSVFYSSKRGADFRWNQINLEIYLEVSILSSTSLLHQWDLVKRTLKPTAICLLQ